MESASKRIYHIYDTLLKYYGKQNWWPGNSYWEVCIGALLTQNTNWNNVEKALHNLKSKQLLPENNSESDLCIQRLLNTPLSELEQLIRPSGYYRMKAKRLIGLANWWNANVENNALPKTKSLNEWRNSLLAVKGVGPETADSILLYAFQLPIFVIDTYTKRLMERHFGTSRNSSYDELQQLFMNALPHETTLFNEFHALIVQLGKDDCPKSGCSSNCPLKTIDHNIIERG